ncbi:valine--tRNA ligase [Acetobacteraceae bacterium]|nr:valine--tRNA ligase [Acetobacteraceae bacterium]
MSIDIPNETIGRAEVIQKSLGKSFESSLCEKQLMKKWLDQKLYASKSHVDPKNSYSIMFPPPNVTGKLHIGHALTFTLQDILIRRKRLEGKEVLWQAGTDHAGIATQVLIEKRLDAQGENKEDLGREKFFERVWEWKEESGGIIIDQLKRLGASADWDRERFTMDEGLSKAVITAFVRLYKDGLIKRDYRLVNWDSSLKSAVSDIEVENKETKGKLYYIRYPLESGEFLSVATTRPETLFGDMALAVHPEDPRFEKYIGQYAKVPFVDRRIKILADTHSDPEKGTGVVKITPAHDFNDFEVGKRHQLEMPIILDVAGKFVLSDLEARHEVFEDWVKESAGLSVRDLRKKVVQKLEQLGFLEKIEEHSHAVPHSDRTGVVIEPRLTMQWYCDAPKLAEKAVEAVRSGDVQFEPKQWENTYFAWMKNLQPWCISRQLWWGHQIPAWYDERGNEYVAETEEEAQIQAGENVTLTRDPDVLDTWFSSGLWPFATLGWPEKTAEFSSYYPTSVLVTGFDIIFFWVSRMMMLGLYFTEEVPFEKIVIHGLVRDENGQKMSKSKGNGIDPLEIIDEYGADALRLALCAGVTLGRDIRISGKIVEDHRNFITKLWNVARFLEMNNVFSPKISLDLEDQSSSFELQKVQALQDWIEIKFRKTSQDVENTLANYRFADYAQSCMHFVRDIFCDWFVELAKPILNKTDKVSNEFRIFSREIFFETLKLLEPIIPFVTNMLIEELFPSKEISSRFDRNLPFSSQALKNEENVDSLIELIGKIRAIRSEMNIAPSNKGKLIALTSKKNLKKFEDKLSCWSEAIDRMGRISEFKVIDKFFSDLESAAEFTVLGETFYLPLKGLIDFDKEYDRLSKEYSAVEKEFLKTEARLNNKKFIERAKPEVVIENKDRLGNLREEKVRLFNSLERIKKLTV